MLKYVAIMSVDEPERWHKWHQGPTDERFRSPECNTKVEAEQWIESELLKYPERTVNSKESDKKYFIRTYVIAYDVNESENFEELLTRKIGAKVPE